MLSNIDPGLLRATALAVLLAIAGGTALHAAASPNGVFTQEQATNGKRAYDTQCAMCHGAKLLGPNAPALIGADVMQNFDTVAGLYNYTAAAMPPQAPGRLTQQDYVNITAYILQANGARAGDTELTANQDRIARIVLTSITGAHAGTNPAAGSVPAPAPARADDDVPQAYTWGKTLPRVN